MKRTKLWMRILLSVLCAVTLISLVSCSADVELGNNTELGKEFLSYTLKDDYDAAYKMVSGTVSDEDFRPYWDSIRDVVKDASSYEIRQIGWYVNTTNGVTTRTTAYQVDFNNGKIALFRIITCKDAEGIAGLHFSDITAFQSRANAVVPVARVILIAVSLLSVAFAIWMFVDCLRRKIKLKVLWAILMFFGIAFTLTLGEKNVGFHMFLGLILNFSSIVADPATLSFEIQLVFPLGAILYLCLRKKLLLPEAPAAEVVAEFTDLSSANEPKNEEISPENPDGK